MAREDWVATARAAYAQGYVVLDLLAAVDERDRPDEPGLDVVAELITLPEGGTPQRLRLVTRVPDGTTLDSLADVWAGASWQERAAADLSGLSVGRERGAPGRLLLPEGYTGPPPLAKTTVLAARASTPWPGAPEPGESMRDAAAGAAGPPGVAAAGAAGGATPPAGRRTQRRRQRPPGVPDEWPI